MKKALSLGLIAFALIISLGSCTQPTSPSITIVGTWTLSTVQGVSASLAETSGSIVVASNDTYTSQTTIMGIPASTSGTVASSGGNSYLFTQSDGTSFTATISSDGKSLSYTSSILGPLVYTK